jgi:PTS system nitrogen regulatory IIA component
MPMKPVTISALIAPARVVSALQAQDLLQAVERLAGIAACASSLDAALVFRAVLERSLESSFSYGRGVALPHAMVAGLKEPIGVFARLSPALDIGAPDDREVDLLLLILGPEGDDAMLLRALACAARRLRDPDVAARLRSADGAEAIHVVLTTDAWRGEAGSSNEMMAKGRTARI